MDHALRYAVANEFVDVVKGLWDGWNDGAIVADTATGIYLDPARVRPLHHAGRFFQVRAAQYSALPARPSGDHPGRGSPADLELAARTADVVFSVVQELESARQAYADLKGRLGTYGRARTSSRCCLGLCRSSGGLTPRPKTSWPCCRAG